MGSNLRLSGGIECNGGGGGGRFLPPDRPSGFAAVTTTGCWGRSFFPEASNNDPFSEAKEEGRFL